MKLFEEQRPPQDAAAVVSQLFREFKEIPFSNQSRNISPSGLSCQVCAAFKLQGVQGDTTKESFQSLSFADAGEDRHKRIQAFLSKTEYWVDVAEYIKEKKLPLRAVIKVNNDSYDTEERKLPREIYKEEAEEFLKTYNLPREALLEDEFETLLVHTTLPIRFKCDGILLIEGVYYILEIKTEGNQKSTYRTTYDPKHQLQGTAYTWLFKVGRILWIYEDRDKLTQKVFVQLVTPQEKIFIRDYIQEIVDNKDTPENLRRSEGTCKYCPYKKHCKAYFKEIEKRAKETTVQSNNTDK